MDKLDRFFKKKVEELSVGPRPEAWSKLESKLSKKNKGLIWFRSAAAIVLTGLLISFMIWMQKSNISQSITQQVKKENSSNSEGQIKLKKDSAVQFKSFEVSNDKGLAKQSAVKKNTTTKIEGDSKDDTEKKSETLESEILLHETVRTETVAIAVVEKPIVIEYTLETIPLRKKETPVVAEAASKKNSLQKAIDFAREAKNSDSPLGELRQAKDDLFALNFKKDKQKKQ